VPGAVDSTAYGAGRQSTTSHYAHHTSPRSRRQCRRRTRPR